MKYEDEREETPFATRDNMLDIRKHITELCFRGFGLKRRKLPKTPRNFAEIVYAINSLPEDVADGINASIEESTDAIMELAEMTDEVKTMMERNEAQFEERDTRLSNHDKQFGYVTETLTEYDGRMNTLADRIARLENLIGG